VTMGHDRLRHVLHGHPWLQVVHVADDPGHAARERIVGGESRRRGDKHDGDDRKSRHRVSMGAANHGEHTCKLRGFSPDSWGKSGILAIPSLGKREFSLPLALIFLKKMVGGTGIEPVTPPV